MTNLITVLYFLGYITIGVIVALLFSWKRIVKDHIDMLVVTYFWPVFVIYFIAEKIFVKWPSKFYKKWNDKMRKRGK